MPQALTTVTPNAAGGTLAAGTYSYVITAATAYGESEPSLPQSATVGAGGSVTLSWPDATNGTGTAGNAGPTLADLEAEFTGGTGFWGYNIYREDPGTTDLRAGRPGGREPGPRPLQLHRHRGHAPGAAPDSSDTFPTATNPGIDCSSAPGSWEPAADPSQPDRRLDRHRDRPRPRLRRRQRTAQLHAGRRGHR